MEGAADAFCCAGCEMAYAIIRGAGLERYYAEREAFAPRPEPLVEAWATVPTETRADGTQEARLQVDGLRCASCVWVVERVLEQAPGVRDAHVSYASGRATLRWDPQATDLGALAGRIAALGYRPRALGAERRVDRGLLYRLGVAAFAAAGVMLFYEGLYAGWWYGAIDPGFAALFRWASLALATPVTIWCASPFFAGAWNGVRHRVLHMDLPIAVGIAVMYAHGAAAALLGRDGYLDSLTMLVAFLLAGRVLEAHGRRRAADAAIALVASAPRAARRATPEGLETVPVSALRPGDVVDVGAGEELPADGVVTEGAGQVRTALLTGEAEPVMVAPGERVHAGTVLVDGALSVRVEAVGAGTVLRRMAARLEAAADRGVRPTSLDRIAPWFTAATLLVSTAVFLGWFLGAGVDAAVAHTVAVLVVACPCALALSHPLAATAGLGAAARRGLLLRSPDVLAEIADADLVVLDKTGTVTEGALAVLEAEDAALRVAAGLERFSHHPIARAVVAEASRRGIPLPRGEGVREEPGEGIAGRVDGRAWRLRSGGPGLLLLEGDAGARHLLRLGDAVRADAAATIAALRREGLEVVLLTGDHAEVAWRVATAAGVSRVVARVGPAEKAEWVEARRGEGRRVLFAGDGLNDGPALAAADVGIAMAAGAASSVLVADGVISTASLAPILAARRAARAARRVTRTAQRHSIAYNVLAVGAAAAGVMSPLVAALLMPLSSLVVLWGAARVEALVRREEACRG